MDSDKKPRFIHLVIAIESVVLLAFLLMLTPIGGRLTLRMWDQRRTGRRRAEYRRTEKQRSWRKQAAGMQKKIPVS